jgi:hypothetical protein
VKKLPTHLQWWAGCPLSSLWLPAGCSLAVPHWLLCMEHVPSSSPRPCILFVVPSLSSLLFLTVVTIVPPHLLWGILFIVAPAVHPASSCSHQWGQVLGAGRLSLCLLCDGCHGHCPWPSPIPCCAIVVTGNTHSPPREQKLAVGGWVLG